MTPGFDRKSNSKLQKKCGQFTYAPIALFIYNRPEHTRKVITSLHRCRDFDNSTIYVFCDGPKASESDNKVGAARSVARQLLGSRAIIEESPFNKGLAISVIQGVTRLCEEYGRVIVLEDDLLVAPSFLEYMNTALQKYEDHDSVMQISGHMFPVPEFVGEKTALFLPFTTSWGWATWKRAWQYFDADTKGWEKLIADKELQFKFNVNGSFDYYSMLKRQMNREIDSWAIRWYWSVFKRGGLTLFPRTTLVENIGFDGSGTHGWRSARRAIQHKSPMIINYTLPNRVSVSSTDMKVIHKILSNLNPSWLRQIHAIIKMLHHRR